MKDILQSIRFKRLEACVNLAVDIVRSKNNDIADVLYPTTMESIKNSIQTFAKCSEEDRNKVKNYLIENANKFKK